MAEADKGFKVDPDALDSVADTMQSLLEDVSGDHGSVSGSLKDFQLNAGDIGPALATFWGTNENVFAEAYADEHAAILKMYTAITGQLQNLVAAARQTAAAYRQQEQASAQTMNSMQ